MSYTVDERNTERQQLLAEILEKPTREVLGRIPRIEGARCLDLGCGQGNTTRLLAEIMTPIECIGLDSDAALVRYAQQQHNPAGVRFQQGDATALPFASGTFDLVFCRFLLIHMPDPVKVIREMLRVTRPGGYVVAFEADFSYGVAYPHCPALDIVNKAWSQLFQDSNAGRKLVHYFRDSGARGIEAGAFLQLEHDMSTLKRMYRLSAEATEAAAQAKGILTASEVVEMIDGLARLEDDPGSVVMPFPDIWAIGRA